MADEPHILTVTELTQQVRGLIEEGVGDVWVEGEISNLRKQASGHQYFTLKDERSQLSCVLFYRPGLRHASIPLAEGMLVHARGQMTVYEARGQYQLNVRLIQAAGAGLLAAKFEALKRRLDAEGLFDPAHKRAIPKFPKAVGIVTSPTGAAIADMLNILHRRAPWIHILIHPVRVQGAGAGPEIAAAVAEFNSGALPPVDALIVSRGGGSAEDLWEFNDETLARAIYASRLPVISAVGHEIDFTIADFVADLRAPTPSAAAELLAPDTAALLRHFGQLRDALERRLQACLREWMQQNDDTAQRLARFAGDRLAAEHRRLAALGSALREHRPDQALRIRRGQLAALWERLQRGGAGRVEAYAHRLEKGRGLLRVLGPQSTLSRGYSITRTASGEIVRSVAQAPAGSALTTQVADGEVRSRVED